MLNAECRDQGLGLPHSSFCPDARWLSSPNAARQPRPCTAMSMVILRPTRKLHSTLRRRAPRSDTALGDWYVKGVIFPEATRPSLLIRKWLSNVRS
jgi:hypothetical protein